ncbi:hypothetical protein CLV86_0336 [Lacinutrix venerupis]|uniref:Cytochrome c domain-containing protein n=1 Tax=Lacinutrix venerupis TaxID=1486034 RepID=A0AAC9PVZ4_9FLAO|nr:hypothetical protein [Lacinutrix venerupis]APY00232.1 hypothetical protein BWR22_07865 [Lacinutrix venerupis]RLJ68947.1 hypothetical protein CLV86_0336 [Lacinutrix venerupis]
MRNKYKYTIIIVLFICSFKSFAQDYRKDSLQIKAYTEIKFTAGKPVDIKLKKVFCDYCSKKQLKLLGEDAVRRTENEKHDPKNKLEDGVKKLAVYIRIAKTDFASINEDK